MPAVILVLSPRPPRQNNSYHAAPCCKPAFPRPSIPTERLLFYGDSTVKNSWELLMHMARAPCMMPWEPRLIHELLDPARCPPIKSVAELDPELDRVLMRCTGGAPWTTVPVGTNTIEVSR
jgi:hypothetical protein